MMTYFDETTGLHVSGERTEGTPNRQTWRIIVGPDPLVQHRATGTQAVLDLKSLDVELHEGKLMHADTLNKGEASAVEAALFYWQTLLPNSN